MSECNQTKGLSVLAHGESVHKYFLDLESHILNKKELEFEWKLPDWIYNESIWNNLVDKDTIKNYQIFHDCGKPFCIEVGDDEKVHFPNHADVSADVWKTLNMPTVEVDLIKHDMDIHLLKSAGFDDFKELYIAPTLLITGLCEIHSNASMFGGIDSTSFKIKWKNINKFGKRYVEHIQAVGNE